MTTYSCHHSHIKHNLLFCSMLSPIVAAGPGNPNHPCPQCQAEWIDGEPPTAETMTPTLAGILEMVNQVSSGLFQANSLATASTSTTSQRSECEHLGKIIARHACNCPRRWTRECDLLKTKVSQNNECQQCEHWAPAE